ncbi:hypothetical protein PMAYCL1PPCAC_27844, partial [Pristionchus mayeri]
VSLVLVVDEVDHDGAPEQRALRAHVQVQRTVEGEVVALGEHFLHEAGPLAHDGAHGRAARRRHHRVGALVVAAVAFGREGNDEEG